MWGINMVSVHSNVGNKRNVAAVFFWSVSVPTGTLQPLLADTLRKETEFLLKPSIT